MRFQHRYIVIAILITFTIFYFIFGHLLWAGNPANLEGKVSNSPPKMEGKQVPQEGIKGDNLNIPQLNRESLGTPKELDQKPTEETVELEPCTVIRPISKQFIDLSSLSSLGNDNKAVPWHAKGYDSGLNFTLGICSTPFKTPQTHEVVDVTNSSEVGAYYIEKDTGKYISLGKYSTEPVFRGRKLTLTYNEGSICPGLVDSKTGQPMRKSTVLTFTCDREMMAKAQISYVASFNDCFYMFEVRSHHACPTAAKGSNLSVIWIFSFILLAALAVYSSGGLLYKHMKQKHYHEQLKA